MKSVLSVKSLIATVIFMNCIQKDSTQEWSLVKIHLVSVLWEDDAQDAVK